MQDELDTVQRVTALVVDFFVRYSFQVLGALLIIVAGFVVAGWVGKVLLRALERRHIDVTLRQFIANTVRLVVIALFAVIALGKLGISIAPLIAAVGGVALGAGVALQGPISNYGAGLSIILTRLYKVGDTLEVLNCAGVVTDISLAATRLKAEDGEDIIIPNKQIVGEIHRNSYGHRIVEGRIGVAYSADPRQAVVLIAAELARAPDVATAPAAQVGIDGFEETSITLAYRYWVPTIRYFETRHAVNAAIYTALKEAGVDILPQREVHLVQGR